MEDLKKTKQQEKNQYQLTYRGTVDGNSQKNSYRIPCRIAIQNANN